jgi:hypothetical protein
MVVLGLSVPLAGPMTPADASPLVQVTVDMDTSAGSATVTHEKGETVTFEGYVTVEQPQGVPCTTTMSGSTTSGWTVTVCPEQATTNNPSSTHILVEVKVPKGLADGHTETLTVRASSQIAFLNPTVATDQVEITVKNSSPQPEWTVRILDPRAGTVFTTDDLTINGTASYNLGDVDSVEVKVCTGPWNAATGTTEWTIDYDCENLADGEHTIYVRARSGEEVSPRVELKVEQDRSSQQDDDGGGGTLPNDKGDDGGWLYSYALPVVIIALAAVGVYILYKRRGSEEREYMATHY